MNKHSGEVVELDPRTQDWILLDLRAVPDNAETFLHPQIQCMPDGRSRSYSEYDCLSAYDCGYSANQDSLRFQHEQICGFQHGGLTYNMLLPNWIDQWNRLQVPCTNTDYYIWFRTGAVITLGELFLALGRVCTAASINAFYRTLHIVVVKRRKIKSHAPGSASAPTGLAAPPPCRLPP